MKLFYTFKNKVVLSTTVCSKPTHHTNPQMFLSFPPKLYIKQQTSHLHPNNTQITITQIQILT